MSKSILVIDTPECCMECPMCFQSDEISIGKFEYKKLYSCRYAPSDIEDFYLPDILRGKPNWCPIRDLPEKKEEKQYLVRKDNRGNIETYGETRDMIAVGWNMCIDEILKGVDEND